ncbi:hypothetical protein B0H10DRAFT_1953204 [Mycena sp. CBHHK59/15]|nr:hypothetical protein B0H10DRAFT_1953204 [Mycena sp. CBHHK59/15]
MSWWFVLLRFKSSVKVLVNCQEPCEEWGNLRLEIDCSPSLIVSTFRCLRAAFGPSSMALPLDFSTDNVAWISLFLVFIMSLALQSSGTMGTSTAWQHSPVSLPKMEEGINRPEHGCQ